MLTVMTQQCIPNFRTSFLPGMSCRAGTFSFLQQMKSANPERRAENPDTGSNAMMFQRVSEKLNTALSSIKNVFSPGEKSLSVEELPSPSVDHPGIENVTLEEALEKCPHLRDTMKKKMSDQSNSSSALPGVPCSCPIDHQHGSDEKARTKCPYQNTEAQEWPMRAVLIFVVFNTLSVGIDIEAMKLGVVCLAYYMGMLKVAEFIVLYVTTASMSSYKLLGLLLMLTNQGGPKWSWELYTITPSTVSIGIIAGCGSVAFCWLVKHAEILAGVYQERAWIGPLRPPFFSPLLHLAAPICSEFVYRHYMMGALGRDLGTWFGLVGSSVWYGVLTRGSSAQILAKIFHGLFLGIVTLLSNKNLLVPTVAHVLYQTVFSVFPLLEWLIVH